MSGAIWLMIFLFLFGQEGKKANKKEAQKKLGKVFVVRKKPIEAASDQEVRARDFELMLRDTASDLLYMVPHIHISQHSGSGKGHQIFLRGFDCEHGSDVALFIEGIPINDVGHIHGIGYTDLHFIIPEIVYGLHLIKGPFDPVYGDFAVAGAIDFKIKDRLLKNFAKLVYGSFNTKEFTAGFSPKFKRIDSVFAFNFFDTDGYTEFGKWKGVKFLSKTTFRVSHSAKWFVLLGAYSSDWFASDVIPLQAYLNGDVGFYGGLDDSDGGAAGRYHFSLHYSKKEALSAFKFNIFLVKKVSRIYTNYTYYLHSPENGDQTEQFDSRLILGSNVFYKKFYKIYRFPLIFTAGANIRSDFIKARMFNTKKRERWNTVSNFDYSVFSIGGFLKQEFVFSNFFRIVGGARYDYFNFGVDGTQDYTLPSGYINQDVPLHGVSGKGIFSPKINFILSPHKNFDIFLNFGEGFHSPDPRDPVKNSDYSIGSAKVGEVGFNLKKMPVFNIILSFWGAYLEHETFFDPLQGRSVDAGRSERYGIEFESRLNLAERFYFYFDFSYTKSKLVATGEPIIGSPGIEVSTGIAFDRFYNFSGGAKFRYIGKRTLGYGKLSEDASLVDLYIKYVWSFGDFGITIRNLLNSKWKDAQFYYTSRYKPDIKDEDLKPDYHFTPGIPFSIRGEVTFYF